MSDVAPDRPPLPLRLATGLVVALASLWAVGAIWVDGPLSMDGGNRWLAAGWAATALAALWALRRRPGSGIALWGALFLGVLIPWLQIAPSNDRDWKPEWARTQHITLTDGRLTVHDFRNFDYAADGRVTERWETRSFDLGKLRGMDYFHDAFGGDLLAHPILSFDFGADGHLALSVETRRQTGEGFSTLGGFFRMYELQYLWGSERDFIRVRTNIRDEPVYLYRTTVSPLGALHILLDAVRATNALYREPAFYNTLWANCTTALRAQTPDWRETPLDLRMLANGRLDELVYERDGVVTAGLGFDALRAASFINPAAAAAHRAPDFSARIRQGPPGF